MNLPNLSHLMSVGQLRYIQSTYEAAEYRNPDLLVRDLLPVLQRWRCDVRGKMGLARLRARPFYFYVLARTRYYDDVFLGAVGDGTRFIVNVGAGSDTRAYRFGDVIRQKAVHVWECDQSSAIRAKKRIAQRAWPADHLDYLAVDLHDESWPELDARLRQHERARMLVMLEGVSPYVSSASFCRFLEYLVARLAPGSRVAYDFKRPEVAAGFGASNMAPRPFRLSASLDEVVAFHAGLGFRVEYVETSEALTSRLVPGLARSGTAPFAEDALVQLTI